LSSWAAFVVRPSMISVQTRKAGVSTSTSPLRYSQRQTTICVCDHAPGTPSDGLYAWWHQGPTRNVNEMELRAGPESVERMRNQNCHAQNYQNAYNVRQHGPFLRWLR
jgi:hypothetical protein